MNKPIINYLSMRTNSQKLMVVGLSISLALVLDVSGALHVYHLSHWQGQRFSAIAALLLVGIAIGWAIVAIWSRERGAGEITSNPSPPSPVPLLIPVRGLILGPVRGPIQHPVHEPIRRTIQRLLTILMLTAWIFTWHDFELFLLSAPPGSLVRIVFALGSILLIGAIVFPPAPAWLVAGAAIGGSFVRFYGYANIPIEPTRADMLPLVQGAIGNFLQGQSPYTTYAMPWELPLTYLPVTWMAYIPPHLLALDIRLTNLLAELAIGGVLVWFALRVEHRGDEPGSASMTYSERFRIVWREEIGLLVWGWVFLQPTVQHWSHTTTAPILWLLLVLLLVLVQLGYQRWTAVVLGLGTAASPIITIVGPFVVLGWLREYGVKTTGKLVAIAAGIAAVIILPFLLWAPQQFVLGAWKWFNDNSMFPLMKWETERTWSFMVGLSGLFWRFELVEWLKPIQMVIIVTLMGVFWWSSMRVQQVAALTIAALLLFLVFNPVLWPYLYNAALVITLVAVVGERGEQQAKS